MNINLYAQERGDVISSFTPSDEVKIENAPNFYSIYFSEMRLNDNWNLRLEKRSLILGPNFNKLYEFPVLFKYKLTETINLFGGPQFDFEIDANGELINSTLRGVLGVEKEVTPHFLLEARFNYRALNIKTSKDELPVFKNKSGFNLGSKFKF